MEIYGHSGTGKRRHDEGVSGRNPAGEGRKRPAAGQQQAPGRRGVHGPNHGTGACGHIYPLGKGMLSPLNDEDRIYELCNIQSVSAAIENMLLEATDMGIGSLWICDIFFAYEELCAWMDCGDELVAAVAFGYPEESPPPRPRKKLEDVVVWKR